MSLRGIVSLWELGVPRICRTQRVISVMAKRPRICSHGNLTQVEEPYPTPNPPPGFTSFFTYYTYDLLGHLIGVNMPRPSRRIGR